MALTPVLDLSPRSAVALASLIVLAALMIIAAISDLRRRHIANWLCLAVALMALPYWLASDPTVPRLATQLVSAAIMGAVLMVAFGYRLLGGGDVKLMAALALWLAPALLYETVLMVAISGGVLAVGVILANYRKLSCPTVPYGVAIAFGALYQVGAQVRQLVG